MTDDLPSDDTYIESESHEIKAGKSPGWGAKIASSFRCRRVRLVFLLTKSALYAGLGAAAATIRPQIL